CGGWSGCCAASPSSASCPILPSSRRRRRRWPISTPASAPAPTTSRIRAAARFSRSCSWAKGWPSPPVARFVVPAYPSRGGSIPMTRLVNCVKLGKELPGIVYKPFDNDLGQKIYDNVSQEAWKLWLEHSKMLVNEYRLDLTSKRGQELLLDEADKFF